MPHETPTPDTPLQARTAFLVVQHTNGEWEAHSDITKPVSTEHTASVIEMKFGASEVVSDIEASKQAAITAHQLMAVTAQMQHAAATRSLTDKLKL